MLLQAFERITRVSEINTIWLTGVSSSTIMSFNSFIELMKSFISIKQLHVLRHGYLKITRKRKIAKNYLAPPSFSKTHFFLPHINRVSLVGLVTFKQKINYCCHVLEKKSNFQVIDAGANTYILDNFYISRDFLLLSSFLWCLVRLLSLKNSSNII